MEPDLHPLRLPAPALPQSGLGSVMRRIPTAVAVLATLADQNVHATTVSSITRVSRTPVLISVCLRNGSRTLKSVHRAKSFAISILASGQEGFATRFASPDRPIGPGQFAGVPHHLTEYGPVIEKTAALIGCELHAVHPCGDHYIVVGEVRFADAAVDEHPLIRHDGSHR